MYIYIYIYIYLEVSLYVSVMLHKNMGWFLHWSEHKQQKGNADLLKMLIYFLPVGAAFGKTEYSIFQITVKYKAVGMHGIPALEKYQYLLYFKWYDIIILHNSIFHTLLFLCFRVYCTTPHPFSVNSGHCTYLQSQKYIYLRVLKLFH